MKNIITGCCLCLMSMTLVAQNAKLDWVRTGGGSGQDYGTEVAIDSYGNVYTVGNFEGTVDFDPGTGINMLTSNGEQDFFIQKLDASGNFLWAKSIGGIYNDKVTSIGVDMNDDVILVGSFKDTVDFNPGAGVNQQISEAFEDGFVMKLSSSGNLLWSRVLNGHSYVNVNAVEMDGAGNILIGGHFFGTVDFDPQIGNYNITSIGNSDAFIEKLDPNGNFIWCKSFGGGSADRLEKINLDVFGNIILTGTYKNSGTNHFNMVSGLFSSTGRGRHEVYVMKLDNNADFVWMKKINGEGPEISMDVQTDTYGNIYTFGYYRGMLYMNQGSSNRRYIVRSHGRQDAFMHKMDPSGNYVWSKGIGGPRDDKGLSFALDTQNNIYTVGSYMDTINAVGKYDGLDHPQDWALLPSYVYKLNSQGESDVYINKYNENGDFLWAKSIGGIGKDKGSSIVLSNINELFIVGEYANTVDFDPSSGTSLNTSNGEGDFFTMKLSPCVPSYKSDTVYSCAPFTWIDGITYTESTDSVLYSLTNSTGCDSIVELTLIMLNSSVGVDVQTVCDDFTWVNGVTYTSSVDSVFHVLQGASVNGCDSVTMLDLEIISNPIANDIHFACDNFTWVDGINYTSNNNSATYSIPGASANGCDSTIRLELYLSNTNYYTDLHTSCGSFTWLDGNIYHTSNNTATFNAGIGSNGCDSILTLDLTVHNPSGIDVQTACNSYTWIDGVTYTANNNSATHIIPAGGAFGCDSVVTLDLTIIDVDESVTRQDPVITANLPGAAYQWLDCNNNYTPISGETGQSFTALNNGDYAVEVTHNGCVDTSYCFTISTVSILEAAILNQVEIYPNPTSGLININFGNLEGAKVEIFDMNAKLVYLNEFTGVSNQQISLNEPKGIYNVRISIGEAKQEYKLVLE